MTREQLREAAYLANMQLVKHGLVIYTWGNASQYDEALGEVAIKPSGVPYDKLSPKDIVILDLDGNVVLGVKNPSSDTPTHLALYRAWKGTVGGIVHVHSTYATAWAQAGRDLPCLGTTHADYFYGDIPATRPLTAQEVDEAYELKTGDVIVETFERRHIEPKHLPGALVSGHGPFAWGKDAAEAVHNAVVMEQVAKMGCLTLALSPGKAPLEAYVQDKHFMRKHGPNAYYGQKE